MRAIINIDFKKILGFKVDGRVNDELLNSTENTIQVLCKELKKYFKTKKIKTHIEYEIEN